jgi:hypothetical protein
MDTSIFDRMLIIIITKLFLKSLINFFLQKVDTVSPLANSLKVTKLTPNKEYKFRVRAVNKEGDGPNLETGLATVAKNPYDEPSQPGEPQITDWDSVKENYNVI